MLSALLAAAYTFTATATGLEKGAPVEFFFVGKNSDRDYEALFVLDESVESFCRGVEQAGLRPGTPVDLVPCNLWPVGCPLQIDPPLTSFVHSRMPDDLPLTVPIYTGGIRTQDGVVDAATNQPYAVFALYSLPQSPIVFNGIFEQGVVYNCHHVKLEMKKGERHTFRLAWDSTRFPKRYRFTLNPGSVNQTLRDIKSVSTNGEISLQVDFSPNLTLKEAIAAAKALSVIDSPSVKVNGCVAGQLYYRAFLPLVKWLDRRERIVQPFELSLSATNELVYIEEDWKVAGNDPKLTPKVIPFDSVSKYDRTDTCFIFAAPETNLSLIYSAMRQMKGSHVRNWYVFDAK